MSDGARIFGPEHMNLAKQERSPPAMNRNPGAAFAS
jgi:hypothetical protein